MKNRVAIRLLLACGVLVLQSVSTHAAEDAWKSLRDNDGQFKKSIRPLLDQYCFRCHGDRRQKGDINLEADTKVRDLFDHGRTWRRAAMLINDGLMPPNDAKQPTETERKQLVTWINDTLDRLKPDMVTDPGAVTVRRLNRVEYRNTIRDLVGVNFEVDRNFPADAPGYGFDNIGDTMFMPPLMMEKYFDASKMILREAFSDKALRDKIIVTAPDADNSETDAARQNLRRIMRRAFRRPPADAEIAKRMDLFAACRKRGESFDASMETALQSVLTSPKFLFRIERGDGKPDAHGVSRLTDHELATRLSYFLWSTMPDKELSDLADQGRLSEPQVLQAQVTRMLASSRSRALADHFAGQWFGYREIKDKAMDFRRFPSFRGWLPRDMFEESARFFDSIVREDASVLDLIDADYTFLNGRLAKHYGLGDLAKGDEFVRVKLPDRRRGGMVTHASVLTVTSYPLRTSPVIRGKWVLENMLGSPPPPPPPNAGQLPEDDKNRSGLTVRQQLERHRRDPACASCHATMDPIGFALEKYDGIGRWREMNHDRPIDSAGRLPDGTDFDGPIELKDLLMARKDDFLTTMVEKMMIYSIGRPPTFYDEIVVRDAKAALEKNGYRFSEIVRTIVASYPFQHHRPNEESTEE